MSVPIKSLLKRAFPFYFHYQAYRLLVADRNSYLHQTGWLKSLEQKMSVDGNGSEIPWMNYPVVRFLRERLGKELELFEFGSGNSTTFYARLVKNVTSVEYNESWLQRVKERAPANVKLIYQKEDVDGAYCRSVHLSGRKYDVVIVDGRDRVNCIRQAVDTLSDQGVILLDDSHREKYADGIRHAQEKGFFVLPFEGLKPGGNGIERTTLFYRRNNCVGL